MKKYYTASDHIHAFRRNLEKGLELIDRFGPDKFNKKPDAHGWSLGEILDHVNFVDQLYVDLIDKKLSSAGHGSTDEKKCRHRLWVRLCCKLIEPPYKIKFKVPGDHQPLPELSPEETRTRYAAIRQILIRQAEEGSQLPMDKIKIKAPISDWITLNLSEAFSFLACHQRRHLWQAEQLLHRLN